MLSVLSELYCMQPLYVTDECKIVATVHIFFCTASLWYSSTALTQRIWVRHSMLRYLLPPLCASTLFAKPTDKSQKILGFLRLLFSSGRCGNREVLFDFLRLQ
jgi:hypothetical protein